MTTTSLTRARRARAASNAVSAFQEIPGPAAAEMTTAPGSTRCHPAGPVPAAPPAKIALGWIANGSNDYERQAEGISEFGDAAAFQVDRLRPSFTMQPEFRDRIGGHRGASQQQMPRRSAETIGQAWICRIQPALGQDRVGNDNGPRPERWIQPSGQTKADQGIRTPLDQTPRRIRRTG